MPRPQSLQPRHDPLPCSGGLGLPPLGAPQQQGQGHSGSAQDSAEEKHRECALPGTRSEHHRSLQPLLIWPGHSQREVQSHRHSPHAGTCSHGRDCHRGTGRGQGRQGHTQSFRDMARLAEQSRGSGAKARPHCQPHAPTARVTVPPHTEFHRAVAGVPLSLAQPAAPVHCHILPGITPARTLQRQWHRAGGRAQHWHHSDPPQPLTPPSTHRLCRWMKPRKEPLRRVVRGFSVKSLRAHRSSIPFGIPSLAPTWQLLQPHNLVRYLWVLPAQVFSK